MTEPEKLDLRSHNIVEDKKQDLLNLFPEIRTEDGKIDFERLKLVLGETVDVGKERYGMNWPGKADCFRTIQAPSLGTLRPCPEESVNFDTTENLIIEGDNLEVLKLLQKSYLGKVKMIYIDPPYNTGNDFIYPDNYTESLQTYLEYTGQVDAEGRKFGTNTEADGRFHSKWLNMMYPRLYLARNLLRDDGIIYVSVDSVEVSRLMLLAHEIFGEENFLECLTRVSKLTSNKGVHFSPACDYILAYAKSADNLEELSDPSAQEDEEYVSLFRFEDKRGKYNEVSLYMPSLDFRPNQRYLVECPDGSKVIPPEGRVFRWTKETLQKNTEEDRVVFKKTTTSPLLDERGRKAPWNIYTKIYLHERLEKGLRPSTLLDKKTFTNSTASKELIRLGIPFPFSKPYELVSHLATISGVESEDIILDCFGGSGTTGDAVMRMNAANKIQCRYILVQLPEPLHPEDKDQKEASDFCGQIGKPRNIAELTKERVRRVIRKLNQQDEGKLLLEGGEKQDRGFRVFKLAESNFKTWNADVHTGDIAALKEQLELHVDHIREDRTPDDILYEILLKSGFPATTPVEKLTLAGKTVYSAAGGAFLICLERELTLKLIRAMAQRKPERIVCLDEGFAVNDQLKANAVQTFKTGGVTPIRS